MGNIFISEHLECACICVLCDRTMVDIADWMKQEIFVRLSHDYFTKCQILQAMSYRWADEHNTKMFPHEAYWCHNYRHQQPAMQCNVYFWLWRVISGGGCLVSPAPGPVFVWSRPVTLDTDTTLALAVTWRSHLRPALPERGLQDLRVKCRSWVKLIKTNQASIGEEDKVSFSVPGQIFFTFPLIVDFLSVFYIFELRMTWLDETQIQF